MRHFFSGEKRSSSTTGPLEDSRRANHLDFSNISDRSHESDQVASFAINYHRHPSAKEQREREKEKGEGERNFAANTNFFDKIGKKGEKIEMYRRRDD